MTPSFPFWPTTLQPPCLGREPKARVTTMGQHWMAQSMNPFVQVLSNLSMVAKLEDLLYSLHSYLSNSPKKHFEFIKLVKIMETCWLKILQNVKIWWINESL
jgi:hypothetical protein